VVDPHALDLGDPCGVAHLDGTDAAERDRLPVAEGGDVASTGLGVGSRTGGETVREPLVQLAEVLRQRRMRVGRIRLDLFEADRGSAHDELGRRERVRQALLLSGSQRRDERGGEALRALFQFGHLGTSSGGEFDDAAPTISGIRNDADKAVALQPGHDAGDITGVEAQPVAQLADGGGVHAADLEK
jgi:hypothetical protein